MSALPAAAGGIAVSRALRVVAGRSEAREDLLAFTGRMYPGYQAAPHHRRIAEALEAVERGDTRRLIVTLPPRHGKSLLASQHFPAWFLGRGPDRRIIACSYAASLAYRFSRLARNLLSEPGWPWPEVRTASDLAQVQRWDIAGRRGGYIAAGVGGGITGVGAHCLAGDTPVVTPGGTIDIGTLVRSRYDGPVLACDLRNGKPVWRTVLATRESTPDDLIRVRFASGQALTITPEHLVFVAGDGWVAAGRLQPGDRVRRVDLGEEWGRLFAGCLRGSDATIRSAGVLPGDAPLPCAGGGPAGPVLPDPRDRGEVRRGGLERERGAPVEAGDRPPRRGDRRQRDGGARLAAREAPCPPQAGVDTVAGVERCGVEPVFDLQVEGVANFFASGVLVHNCLIVDDPVKNAEEAASALVRENTWSWFTSTAYTRLEPGGRVVVIGTRWNEDDLIGRALAQGGWEHLDMPAIDEEGVALWPERFDLAALEDIRETLGSRMFEALYQQRPGPAEGAIWRREWWKRYGAAPRLRRVELFVDSAFKEGTGSDWSVIAAWGEDGQGSCYLLDLWRARVEFPELLRAIHDMHARHRDAAPVVPVVIEDRASGQSALQVLGRPMPDGEWGTLPALPVAPFAVRASKVSRSETVSPLAEAGRVFLPADAPWVGEFIEEHAVFPAGRHDDMVDTTAMALHRLRRKKASVGWL